MPENKNKKVMNPDYKKQYSKTLKLIDGLRKGYPQYKNYSDEDWINMFEQIALVESGNKNIRQKSKNGPGPARGYFQMEPESAKTARNRYNNIQKDLKSKGIDIGEAPLFDEDFSRLDKDSQAAYVLTNMAGTASKKRELGEKDLFVTPKDVKTTWLKTHWNGDAADFADRAKHFEEIAKEYNFDSYLGIDQMKENTKIKGTGITTDIPNPLMPGTNFSTGKATPIFKHGGMVKMKHREGGDVTFNTSWFNQDLVRQANERMNAPITTTLSKVIPKTGAHNTRSKYLAKNPNKYNIEDYKAGHQEPGLESIPLEVMLLPGTPVIKGLGKLGNFALDAINPLQGMRNIGKSTGKLNLNKEIKNIFSDEDQMEKLRQLVNEHNRRINLKPTENKESLEVLENFKERIKTPEGQRRLKNLGITEENFLQDLDIIEDIKEIGSYYNKRISIHPEHFAPGKVVRHEIEHGVQDAFELSRYMKAATENKKLKEVSGQITEIDDILSGITLRDKNKFSTNTHRIRTDKAGNVDISNYNSVIRNRSEAIDYFLTGSQGQEKSAFLAEIQQYMMDTGVISKKAYTNVTPEMVKSTFMDAMFDDKKGGNLLRLFNIMTAEPKNYELISKGLNKMLSVFPILGAGALGKYMSNNKSNPEQKRKKGGPVNNNWLDNYN